MNITIVLENYWPHIGGVEVLFQTIAEGLVKKGHKVTVVTHKVKGSKKHEAKNGVKIHRVSCFGSRYLFTFLSIPKAIWHSRKADVIHTTTFNGAGPAWLASKILRKPCLITVHELWRGKWGEYTYFSKLKSKLHDLLERPIFMLRYDKYVTVSNSTKRQLLSIGIPKNKITTIYNGLDYTLFKPKKRKRNKVFTCLSYGRLGPSKGFEYALQAVPKIAKEIPNFEYKIILSRDKQYKSRTEKLESFIKKTKFKDRIEILKPMPLRDLPDQITSADCVIVPSLAEGFGFTVAESCAVGTPVVASNTTSIPEVISGKHVLVPPKNPDAIAEGVVRVFKKKYDVKPLKKFTWSKTVDGYLSNYKKLVSRRNAL